MKKYGNCHLCGEYKKLSFEHVPPKKAFNDKPAIYTEIEKMIDKDPRNIREGEISQKGVGGHTLCEKCNNDTGSWYGNAFVEWVYQGLTILHKTERQPTLYYPFHIFPLRIIKQIICMFFSVNGPDFCKREPELVRFVLNREEKHLNPKIRIYAFYTASSYSRQVGWGSWVTYNYKSGKGPYMFGEITFSPFGYIMSLDSKPHDSRLYDISFFADYSYNDWKSISLRLPVLPVDSCFPGDYRSNEEIQKAFERNINMSKA